MSPPIIVIAVLAALPSARAETLIARLGGPSYAGRERVGLELIELGRNALPALRRGERSADAEIAERCKKLIPLAEAQATGKRLAHLARLLTSRPPPAIPCNEHLLIRFLHVTGDTPVARRLYFDIYKNHGRMLDTVESSNPREASEAFWDYVDDTLMYPDGRTKVDLDKLTFNRADLAVFWFLSADPDLLPWACFGFERRDFPYYTPRHAEGHLAGPDSTPEMRRLFLAWLAGPRSVNDRDADEKMLSTGLGLGLAAGLKEMRPIALQTALNPKQRRGSRAAAFVALQQLGAPEDIVLLTALIEDDTVVFQPQPIRDPETKAVIGDLALAACIRLRGRELADFGFASAHLAPAGPADVSMYVIPNAEQRSAARKKWTDCVAGVAAKGK